MAVSVLMVCLGNICRSPLAEGALRKRAAQNGLDIKVDSAGTGDWHIGQAPDQRAQPVALRLGGMGISGLRGRQLERDDFHWSDHIIAMDRRNLSDLRTMASKGATIMLSMLLDHLPRQKGQPVPDPYYGGEEEFEHVWQLMERAAEKLATQLL